VAAGTPLGSDAFVETDARSQPRQPPLRCTRCSVGGASRRGARPLVPGASGARCAPPCPGSPARSAGIRPPPRGQAVLSVESFGRLGAPALTLLGDLTDQAVQAGGPGLSRAAFISGALRELGVALCRGNASLCRSGAYVATRAAGRAPMRGLAQPSAEVV
jgi:hypothetical protein